MIHADLNSLLYVTCLDNVWQIGKGNAIQHHLAGKRTWPLWTVCTYCKISGFIGGSKKHRREA